MKHLSIKFFFLLFFFNTILPLAAQEHSVVSFKKINNAFPIADKGTIASVVFDVHDFDVVKIASNDLINDIQQVTGQKPELSNAKSKTKIIIGTLGKSEVVDTAIKQYGIDISKLQNQWEKFLIQAVSSKKDGQILLIIGSDRRGTAYGVYELSKQIGVSPWHFWADVPIKKNSTLYVRPGSYVFGPPSIQYRGIFINDEERGLGPWSRKVYDAATGTMGPKTYAKIYELMLRLKANVMWPGMKGPESFYSVEGNKEMADRYAIIIGTSHHEPLLVNSSLEWDEEKDGRWQYDKNTEAMKKIMESRVAETAQYENIFTIGLRGHADLGMEAEGGLDGRINLMHRIFSDQRDILQKYINKPIGKIPQAFTAYKEVLELVNNGLNIPDDAILVWPDDNYGYIHQLNSNIQQKRKGGSGVYYHLNYVGRPYSTMWLSAPSPELIRKELNKAYGNGATKFWMFNVGDIKPYEYLTSYCLDMAWDFKKNDTTLTRKYMVNWVTDIFGDQFGTEVGQLLSGYYQIAFERKPEFMSWSRSEPNTPAVNSEFSLSNYNEAQRRLDASAVLSKKTKQVYRELPQPLKSAFFETVYYPIVCTDLTNKKTLYAQMNQTYAVDNRISANRYANLAHQAHDSIMLLTQQFGALEGGKWKEMMRLQWGACSNPPSTVAVTPLKGAQMGIAFSGNNTVKGAKNTLTLPVFNKFYKETHAITVYNKGDLPFDWNATASQPWIILSKNSGKCEEEVSISVKIDWDRIPSTEESDATISLMGTGKTVSVNVSVFNPAIKSDDIKGYFMEQNGTVSIYAANYNRKNDRDAYKWVILNDIGISGSSVAISDDTLPQIPFEWNLEKNAPSLEYDFYTFNQGWMEVQSFTLPTHPINRQRGCFYGISIDNQPPKIIDFSTRNRNEEWKENVMRNASIQASKHFIEKPGKHTLKIWLIDTDVCFDKFLIDIGGLQSSYVGPQQTRP